MDNPLTHSEVTVIGGGMIGAATALGLAQAGFCLLYTSDAADDLQPV